MLRIEDFHALLTSDSEDSPLLTALRELRREDSKGFFAALVKAEAFGWFDANP
jgi:hypothetical protein